MDISNKFLQAEINSKEYYEIPDNGELRLIFNEFYKLSM